jgi:hypothetical protein
MLFSALVNQNIQRYMHASFTTIMPHMSHWSLDLSQNNGIGNASRLFVAVDFFMGRSQETPRQKRDSAMSLPQYWAGRSRNLPRNSSEPV